MKCQVPQISWHSRDPILSIDFQPGKQNIQRLASAGTDSHVLIWYVIQQDNKSIKIECASDLNRHSKTVNVVRFSPSGEFLVSGDDEGAMFVWQLKERDGVEVPKDDENINQEEWFPLKLLRGHLEDIYDISWSMDGSFLVSASMDNTAIVWDMQKYQKVHMFSESKGYIQGVAWDPLNKFIASIGTDRTLRYYNINSKKMVCRVQYAPWSVTTEKGSMKSRLFYDDTLKSYFRRLCFTPDGELLIVPSGILERQDQKSQNTTYIFSRHAPNKPVIQLPVGDKYSVAVRCNPLLYKLRSHNGEVDKENQHVKSMIDLPYRIIFAVAACDSILLYDTEQLVPFAYVSNIHYTHLTDLTWSPDGRILMASSTDGYCSILTFSEEELGVEYIPEPEPQVEIKEPKETIPAEPKESIETNLDSPSGKKLNASNVIPIKSITPNGTSEKDTKLTDSPKVLMSSLEPPKSNKKPKVRTIMNFFASPAVKSVNSSKQSTTVDISTPKEKDSEMAEEEAADPLQSKNDSTEIVKKQNISVDKPFCSKVNAMDVDIMDNASNSLEVIFETKTSSTETIKKPKCKTQLNFTTKVKSIENTIAQRHVEFEINTNAVSSFGDTVSEGNTVENIEENANDWKLELSQDESIITPMETEEPIAAPNSNKASDCNKTPDGKTKRRISFVTLSKTTTISDPK